MRTTTVHLGRQGKKGTDGDNGVGVGNIRKNVIDNPVLSLFQPNDINKFGIDNGVYTRDSEGAIENRYGKQTLRAGTTVSMIVDHTTDFTEWGDSLGNWAVSQNQNQSDPDGGNNASLIFLGSNSYEAAVTLTGFCANTIDVVTFSMWLKLVGSNRPANPFLVTVSTPSTSSQLWLEYDESNPDWQQLTGTISTGSVLDGIGGTLFDVRLFTGTPGVSMTVFLYQVQITKGTTLFPSIINNTGFPVEVPNTFFPEERDNEKGYLIEGPKRNLCTHSNRLQDWDFQTSGIIYDEYPLPDQYGNVGRKIAIGTNLSDSFQITTGYITQDPPENRIQQGVEYNVSLYAVNYIGSVTSLGIRLGGADSTSGFVTIVPTDTFERITFKAVAGSSEEIDLQCTLSDSSARVVIDSIMVEVGDESTPWETGQLTTERAPDIVSIPFVNGMPDYNKPLTIFIQFNDIDVSDLIKTLYSDDLDQLTISLQGNDLLINGTLFPNAVPSKDICITSDGTIFSVYADGVFIFNSLITGGPFSVPTTSYFGSNKGVSNFISGYLQNFRAYDRVLNEDEILYLSKGVSV